MRRSPLPAEYVRIGGCCSDTSATTVRSQLLIAFQCEGKTLAHVHVTLNTRFFREERCPCARTGGRGEWTEENRFRFPFFLFCCRCRLRCQRRRFQPACVDFTASAVRCVVVLAAHGKRSLDGFHHRLFSVLCVSNFQFWRYFLFYFMRHLVQCISLLLCLCFCAFRCVQFSQNLSCFVVLLVCFFVPSFYCYLFFTADGGTWRLWGRTTPHHTTHPRGRYWTARTW